MEDEKPPIAWDEPENKRQLTLRELLRPSLITMAICGCYTYDPWIIRPGQSKGEGWLYRVLGTLYRIFWLIVCLIAFGKAFAAFSNVPSDFLLMNIVKTIWYSQCFFIFLISLKSSFSKRGSQKVAFDFWDEKIWPEMTDLGIKLPVEQIRNRQMIYIAVAIFLTTFSVVCNMLMFTDVISDRFKVFLAAPFVPSIPVLIIDGFILTVITMLWFLPVSYMMTVSTVIASTFARGLNVKHFYNGVVQVQDHFRYGYVEIDM